MAFGERKEKRHSVKQKTSKSTKLRLWLSAGLLTVAAVGGIAVYLLFFSDGEYALGRRRISIPPDAEPVKAPSAGFRVVFR